MKNKERKEAYPPDSGGSGYRLPVLKLHLVHSFVVPRNKL